MQNFVLRAHRSQTMEWIDVNCKTFSKCIESMFSNKVCILQASKVLNITQLLFIQVLSNTLRFSTLESDSNSLFVHIYQLCASLLLLLVAPLFKQSFYLINFLVKSMQFPLIFPSTLLWINTMRPGTDIAGKCAENMSVSKGTDSPLWPLTFT